MENNQVYNSKPVVLLSSAGFLAGLYYAFKTEKKFWGYVGFGLLGSIAGSTAGTILTTLKK